MTHGDAVRHRTISPSVTDHPVVHVATSPMPGPVGAPPTETRRARARSRRRSSVPAYVPPPTSGSADTDGAAPCRDGNHTRRLSLAPPRQRDADARAMLIMPGRFHQQPPHQRVPGAGDATTSMLVPTGVLAGHQPQVRHQRRRGRESSHVMQLGQDQHGRQRIPRKHRNHPTGSRYGSRSAISASRASNSSNRASV